MAGRTGLRGPDIGARIEALGTSVQKSRPQTMGKALFAAEREHLRVMRQDSGGDLRLSGVGKAKGRPGNAKIGTRVKVGSTGSTGTIEATGPLPIIANDTPGHVIRSAFSKGRARKGFVGPTAAGQFKGDRRAVLNIPGVGFRRSARHPGTKGKDTWNRGRKAAEPKIRVALRKNTTAALARALRG